MKMLTLVLLFVGCLCAAAAPPNLDELKWKRRVVVIYAPAGSEEKGQRQQKFFAAEKAGFEERDVTDSMPMRRDEMRRRN